VLLLLLVVLLVLLGRHWQPQSSVAAKLKAGQPLLLVVMLQMSL
jgi:hypothetical protein